MKDRQSVAKGRPSKKKDKVPNKKEHWESKYGRSEKNSKKGAATAKIPPLTKAGQGEKMYSCLGHECEETFDAWRDATRHMQKCEQHQQLENKKPDIHLSRKKANDLLQEGKTSIKSYPVPTEEELVEALRESFSKGPSTKVCRKDVLPLAIRNRWGPGEFSKFGFGTIQDFLKRHDVSPEESEVKSPEESEEKSSEESEEKSPELSEE
jgi:hypothetical protein